MVPIRAQMEQCHRTNTMEQRVSVKADLEQYTHKIMKNLTSKEWSRIHYSNKDLKDIIKYSENLLKYYEKIGRGNSHDAWVAREVIKENQEILAERGEA